MPLKMPKREVTVAPEYSAWRNDPSPQNVSALLQHLRPTIDKAIYAFAGGDSTLRVRAKMLALQAAKSYDPSRGAALDTHVYGALQRLNRLRQQRGSPVKVPESVRNTQTAVIRFRQDWRERHDAEPSMDDIRSHLGISQKQLDKAFGASAARPTSTLVSEQGDAWLGPAVDTDREARRIFMDYVYHDQDAIGKQLMELTMGYGGRTPIPKAQAAAVLKISAPAVSQRLDNIMKKLDETPRYARPEPDEFGDSGLAAE